MDPLFLHKEEDIQTTCKWRVTISSDDDCPSHTYEIEASDHMSTHMFYQVIVAGLKLFGFKK